MSKEFEVFGYMEDRKPMLHNLKGRETKEDIIFLRTCAIVDQRLKQVEEEESTGQSSLILDRQKKAIQGFQEEVSYYKDKIRDIIQKEGFGNCPYPPWYDSLEDAVYHENLGYAGLSEWIEGRSAKLLVSSSAKVIGERIYFLIDGKMVLQPQKISKERRIQLRRALLLATPEKREGDFYHEVYLQDGTRVTIYNEGLAKNGQDCIVFRKFFVQNFTFEEQAKRHTIPLESIPLFKSMVRIGYNIACIGAVKTTKTTFLTTWQSYENPVLEGVMVESDPEIPLHVIMPEAVIMQFVPRDEDLPFVVKKIMRSDADYIIMAEARDGIALNTAVKAANKGTKRVKITFHTTDALDFCYDVADEIVMIQGGDLGTQITKVAKSFHYLFQFIQLADKSKKRLKAIWEIRYDLNTRQITMHQLCKYNYEKDDWSWAYHLGEDKVAIGYEEDTEALHIFKNELKSLALKFPIEGESTYVPSYDHLIRGGR